MRRTRIPIVVLVVFAYMGSGLAAAASEPSAECAPGWVLWERGVDIPYVEYTENKAPWARDGGQSYTVGLYAAWMDRDEDGFVCAHFFVNDNANNGMIVDNNAAKRAG